MWGNTQNSSYLKIYTFEVTYMYSICMVEILYNSVLL